MIIQQELSGLTQDGKYSISGHPYSTHRATVKSVVGAVLLLGALLCGRALLAGPSASDALEWSDLAGLLATLGGILALVGVMLPHNRHSYLDVAGRELVRATHYGWYLVGCQRQSLEEFDRVMARLVCHPDEGGYSYTGSIGLKPVGEEGVLWLKDFPTTGDTFPAAAVAWALELGRATGLPVDLGGWGGSTQSSQGAVDVPRGGVGAHR